MTISPRLALFAWSVVAPLSALAGVAASPERVDILELFREIARADAVELLEGLPHPVFEQGVRRLEEARVQPAVIGSELFYREPMDVPAAVQATLVRLTTDLKGLSGLLGPLLVHHFKFCGGFHADYALRWSSQGTVVATALVCFGCSEVRYLWRAHTLTADYRSERVRELALVFRPLRRNRPVTDLFRGFERTRKQEPFRADPPAKIELGR
jgi:hypothetical protein